MLKLDFHTVRMPSKIVYKRSRFIMDKLIKDIRANKVVERDDGTHHRTPIKSKTESQRQLVTEARLMIGYSARH